MIYQLPVDGERKLVLPLPPPDFSQYGDVWVSYMSDPGNVLAPQPFPPSAPAGSRKDGVVPLRTFVLSGPNWHGLGGPAGDGLWVCAPGGRWPIKLNAGDQGIVVERTDDKDYSPLGVLIEVYPH